MTVEYKEVGVKLEVLPRINDFDKETITLVIKPSVSTISQWVESGNNKAPQISERSAETTVRVKNGETILIGGLLKNEEIKSIKQIPILSKIPILGELFKSRSTDKKDTEVVIAITPTIVYDQDGRPRVETQTTTKSLHEKLNELRSMRTEEMVNPRTDLDAKAEIDFEKAAKAAKKAKAAKSEPAAEEGNEPVPVPVKQKEIVKPSKAKEEPPSKILDAVNAKIKAAEKEKQEEGVVTTIVSSKDGEAHG